jgi:tetratricopeptide (TPR) repeat protein
VRCSAAIILAMTLCSSGCSIFGGDKAPTIASLENQIDTSDDIPVESSYRQAAAAYREFLDTDDQTAARPQAMRRLADISLEADPLVEASEVVTDISQLQKQQSADAIILYTQVLERYPDREDNDAVLYQLSRAYEYANDPDKSLLTLAQLVQQYPQSQYRVEAHFRRGEILFVQQDYLAAEKSYQAVVDAGDSSSFYRQSLYKTGWCYFKQSLFNQSFNAFTALLDLQLQRNSVAVQLEQLSRADRELIYDTLRAMSLGFSYENGASSVADYYSSHGRRVYEDIVYDRLGLLFLEKERYIDAAQTFQMFVEHNQIHQQAPAFQMRVIETYQQGGFPTLVLQSKKAFVDRYQLQGEYWQHHSPQENEQTVESLKLTMTDLSRHYHSLAQKNRKPADYQEAFHWYRTYLASFDSDQNAPKMNFLLAELLYESSDYEQATREYENTAYEHDEHPQAGEAGYAAVLAYSKHEETLTGTAKQHWHGQATENALRFAQHFPAHPQSLAVLTRTSEDLLAEGQHERAANVAQTVIDHDNASSAQLLVAWTVLAHARFDQGDYLQAESSYQQVLQRLPPENSEKEAIIEKLAASIYKQGEIEDAAENTTQAVAHFQRVAAVAPTASIAATAEFDAAAGLMRLQQWAQAASVLDQFRQRYPDDPRQDEANRRLASAYLAEQQPLLAAVEFEHIGRTHADPELRRQALWQAAELYTTAEHLQQSAELYRHYIAMHPQPLEEAVEARQHLADYYQSAGDRQQQLQWLKDIIQADRQAGSAASSRTGYLAAKAQYQLAEEAYIKYQSARLGLPLKKSLAVKRQLMENALKNYEQAAAYDIAEVTTATTYRTAEIYLLLSTALMESDRPPGLSGEALEQYDILLEEQAYPFEEQGIMLHETNIARIDAGVYDSWIEKSMQQLAVLVPGRHGKLERSASYVEAIN